MSEDLHKLKAALEPTSGCPPIEQFGRYTDGVLDASVRTDLESHLAHCTHCQSELALLRQFVEPLVRPEEERSIAWITAQLRSRAHEIHEPFSKSEARQIPWWRTIFTPPALGRTAWILGCLVIIISGSIYLRRGSTPGPVTILDSDSQVLRSNAVVLISPKGDLIVRPVSLKWQGMPGAARYRVSILEVDRTELWKTETAAISVEIPAGVRDRIVPAKSLLWQVTALDSEGRQLGSSNLEKFRVVPDR